MKNLYKFLTAIIFLFLSPTIIRAQTNLLTNGDFESGTTGWFEQDDIIMTEEIVEVFAGVKSLKLEADAGSSLGQIQHQTEAVAVTQQPYINEIWVKGDASTILTLISGYDTWSAFDNFTISSEDDGVWKKYFSIDPNDQALDGTVVGTTCRTRYRVSTAGATVYVDEASFTTSAYWTGATSSDWNTGSNWYGGLVPSTTDNVTISASATNDPLISSNITVANLYLEDLSLIEVSTGFLTITGDLNSISSGDIDVTGTGGINVQGEVIGIQSIVDYANLITNGGFESGVTGWLEQFSAVISEETSIVYEGNKSLKLVAAADGADVSDTDDSDGIVLSQIQHQTEAFAVSDAGYIHSLWVNAPEGTIITVQMAFESPVLTKFANFTVGSSDDNEWKQFFYSVSNDGGSTHGRSRYRVSSAGATAYFDKASFSTTALWTGDVDSDWHNASNWYGGVVPSEFIDASIPVTDNAPLITTDVEALNLYLEDLVVLSVNSGTLTVNGDINVIYSGKVDVASGASVIVEGEDYGNLHTVSRVTTFDEITGQYSIIGSPVVGATTDVLGDLVYAYDESIDYGTNGNGRFVQVTSAETMEVGEAYFSAFTGAVTFTGAFNTGNIDLSLTYESGEGSNAGFNLVSNPYASALDFTEFVNVSNNSDISGTIYLWDDENSDVERGTNSNYITVNSIGVAENGSGRNGDWNGYIGSAQGFFVKATSAGTVHFTTEMQATGNNSDGNFFRKVNEIDIQSLKLRLSDLSGQISSNTLIGFLGDATIGYDRLYDAEKIDATSAVSLFSMLDDMPLAIQGVPLVENEVSLPLGINITTEGEYIINQLDKKNWPEGTFIYLEDNELGLLVSLDEPYSFSGNPGTSKARFNLIVSTQSLINSSILAINDLSDNSLSVKLTNSEMVIFNSTNNGIKTDLMLMDLSGKVLLNKQLDQDASSATVSFDFLSNKLYLLKLTTDQGSQVTKFVIK